MRLNPARGEILENFGFRPRSRGPAGAGPMLAPMRSGTDEQRQPDGDDDGEKQRDVELHQAGPVDRHEVGIGDEVLQRHGEPAGRPCRHGRDDESRDEEEKPGDEVLALGDVALLQRIVELLLRRVVCFLVLVLSSSATAYLC